MSMTIPVWVLLGFALWTLALLLLTVGVYRWSQILTGRAPITQFVPGDPRGADWYHRAMRAHANCIENLPVYGAIVVAALASGADSAALDTLALVLLGSRIVQSIVHVGFPLRTAAVFVRFLFFFAQVICMIAMAVLVARHATA